ncbi:MAG: serine hydrolase domain-containing protein [Acidimicrobiales bacterium]
MRSPRCSTDSSPSTPTCSRWRSRSTSRTPTRSPSCTKSFVAATVVELAAAGTIILDAPVLGLLADPIAELFERYEHARAVTVRHILQHRSGLVDHTMFPAFTDALTGGWTPASQLAIAVAEPARFAPGDAFSYSDSGYVLLGQMIEHVTGTSLAAAVRTRAGLDSATLPSLHWERAEPTPAGVVRVHQWFDGHDTFAWDPALDLFGGGGLVSTLTDLARWWSNWCTGVHGHVGINLADAAATAMPDGATFPGGDRVGLGLFGRTVAGRTVWSHGGFWGLEAGHVPDLGVAYAVAVTHRRADPPGPSALAGLTLDALGAHRR